MQLKDKTKSAEKTSKIYQVIFWRLLKMVIFHGKHIYLHMKTNLSMPIKDKMTYWVEMSDYDFDTANAMLDTKRYLYVGFMCHQVIEKILKAYWSKV